MGEEVNSLRPSDAYLRQLTRPSYVQIKVRRLFGFKPVTDPMLRHVVHLSNVICRLTMAAVQGYSACDAQIDLFDIGVVKVCKTTLPQWIISIINQQL